MGILKSTIAFVVLAGSVSAFAQKADRSINTQYSTTRRTQGWLPSVGLGVGHLDQSGNSAADGEGYDVKAVGTFYPVNSPWIFDGGLGVHKQSFNNDQGSPTVGLFTVSGRYEVAPRWSVGPVLDTYVGSGNFFGHGGNITPMLGVVGAKEFLLENDQMIRVGLKYSSV